MNQIKFDLNLYPTLKRFALSQAAIRIVIGPAGSAKTSYCALEVMRLACLQQPAADGVRYFKALVARQTYQMLQSSTIDTFKRMLGDVLTFKVGKIPPEATGKFKLQDGTYVDLKIEFVSFDSEDAQAKLRGYEPTVVFLDEVSEMPESLITAALGRTGRYPSGKLGSPTRSGVIAATNGPLKRHWLYHWSQGGRDDLAKQISAKIGMEYFELFQQPAGLIRPKLEGGEWLPNPYAENIHNLEEGYGYYYKMLGSKEADIQAFVEGRFADLVTGKVVYPEFSERHIVDEEALNFPARIPLYFGFDFGRTPVCVIATMTTGGRLIVLEELVGTDISVKTLLDDYVIPCINSRYRYAIIEGAWGDPAGMVNTQAVETSPYDVIRAAGIPIEDPGGANRLGPRIESVKQRLTTLDVMGYPKLQVSKRCPYILAAMQHDYVYEAIRGGNGAVRDVPTKSHENWVSDLSDAIQYICLGLGINSGGKSRGFIKHQRKQLIQEALCAVVAVVQAWVNQPKNLPPFKHLLQNK